MPDRLPSLIVLVAVWVPPAMVGWVAAGSVLRSPSPERVKRTAVVLGGLVVAYVAAWFVFNLGAMPPYIPGSVPTDPRIAPPRAVVSLAVFTTVVVLPICAAACALSFRRR